MRRSPLSPTAAHLAIPRCPCNDRRVSHTYPIPGSEEAYPAPRYPDARVRVVPNESLTDWWPYLGELVQSIVEIDAGLGISVELDTSDRTRPNESRGGASPIPGISLVILQGASEALAAQLMRATVAWLRRHLPSADPESIAVRVYAPNGDILSTVEVPAENADQG